MPKTITIYVMGIQIILTLYSEVTCHIVIFENIQFVCLQKEYKNDTIDSI